MNLVRIKCELKFELVTKPLEQPILLESIRKIENLKLTPILD